MTRLLFSEPFNITAAWLETNQPRATTGLLGALTYLADHGRAATAPDVVWHIATSAYGRHSGEIRWPDPELQADHPAQAWRGLFVASTDASWTLFTILGNKATGPHRGNDWYRHAVPVSDRIASDYIARTGLTDTPPRQQG